MTCSHISGANNGWLTLRNFVFYHLGIETGLRRVTRRVKAFRDQVAAVPQHHAQPAWHAIRRPLIEIRRYMQGYALHHVF